MRKIVWRVTASVDSGRRLVTAKKAHRRNRDLAAAPAIYKGDAEMTN
jgi:hypothetical protein